jgi:hypothetical protein
VILGIAFLSSKEKCTWHANPPAPAHFSLKALAKKEIEGSAARIGVGNANLRAATNVALADKAAGFNAQKR